MAKRELQRWQETAGDREPYASGKHSYLPSFKKPFLLMLLTNQTYFYSAFTNMGPFICSGDMDIEKGGNSAPVSIFATGYS